MLSYIKCYYEENKLKHVTKKRANHKRAKTITAAETMSEATHHKGKINISLLVIEFPSGFALTLNKKYQNSLKDTMSLTEKSFTHMSKM